MKSRTLYRLVIYDKDKSSKLLRVVCNQNHLYSTKHFLIVTKSSENPLLLGHLQSHHKFLSNRIICIEESQNSLGLL